MKSLIADNKTIRKRMIDKNITTIKDLSKQSGVSVPKIHEYLTGETPLATTFVRLCKFLDLNPNEVIVEKDESGDNNE